MKELRFYFLNCTYEELKEKVKVLKKDNCTITEIRGLDCNHLTVTFFCAVDRRDLGYLRMLDCPEVTD